LPYPPLEQQGDQERQTPTGARLPGQRGRPAPHLDAAADELVEAVSRSRGAEKKKVFAAQKTSKALMRAIKNFWSTVLK
jgi:hypothetical protein